MITVTLTPAQYGVKVAELKAREGIELAGTSGTVSKEGVTLTYDYNSQAHVLSVNVTHAPPFMTGHITSEIAAWLNS